MAASDDDPTIAPEPAPAPASGPPGRSSRRWWWIGGGVVAVAVVAFLAFAVFGVHTLFFDDEVNEAGPEFASGAELTTPTSTTEAPTTTADPADDAATASTTTTTAPPEPTVTVAGTGSFTGVDHPGEGTVNLLTDGTQTFVRFEDDFSTDNGPDLFAVAYVDGERVELGRLKGNVGAQNYELPAEIDPDSVDQVAVWCKRFDSTFTEAAVSPA